MFQPNLWWVASSGWWSNNRFLFARLSVCVCVFVIVCWPGGLKWNAFFIIHGSKSCRLLPECVVHVCEIVSVGVKPRVICVDLLALRGLIIY